MKENQEFKNFINKVLQGIASWVSYKKQYFSGYHFSEGAITSELYAIINSVKYDKYRMKAEYPYEYLSPYNKKKEFGRKESVDILLYTKTKSKKTADEIVLKEEKEEKKNKFQKIPEKSKLILMEIKLMLTTNRNEIVKDFEKLSKYLELNPNAKGYVMLVSQENINKKYELGIKNAIKKNYTVIDKSKKGGKEINYESFKVEPYTKDKHNYSYSLKISSARGFKSIALKNSYYCLLIEIKNRKTRLKRNHATIE